MKGLRNPKPFGRPSAEARAVRAAAQVATVAQQVQDLIEAAAVALIDLKAEAEELTTALALIAPEEPQRIVLAPGGRA